ncbi:16S rRNA (cytidine(1402)-2'-O)-methyltransferase [Alkalicoccus halolimnae]|uniref:Ribosomal RNA small subunit methyltransferase I n=1 Tax=Alkalicoccus halolimnae TaxID=1667239 RepID=A0A5C7FCP3_9BACI|nr:16S rRNA (cytidine(1402)-2'-O)-methyltransferase [Alkalicoccus halolimnae]TXF82145.1 16S rRNA (cytidine(1402)-2'-O)-methyltransferase [Alkalicoccus halolimnae]
MNEQRSFSKEREDEGRISLVPTPIGNLDDMTYRAVKTLQEADVIAAEDTRHTKKLSHVFEITTPLVSYHEHNRHYRGEELLERVRNGEHVALVSDAGMPAISDPGADLVKEAKAEGLTVVALPGANAALTALIASGLSTESFTFAGFVERKKKQRKEILASWKGTPSTLIFYESPHRLKDMLQAAADVFGDRQAAVGREMTKQYETVVTGTLSELVEWAEGEIKGECVLLIAGASEADQEEAREETWWEKLDIIDHVETYVKQGQSAKQAIKAAALDRGVPKREVYQAYHVDK